MGDLVGDPEGQGVQNDPGDPEDVPEEDPDGPEEDPDGPDEDPGVPDDPGDPEDRRIEGFLLGVCCFLASAGGWAPLTGPVAVGLILARWPPPRAPSC